MSTRLFLVRHGESVWNADQRIQGQADPPLSALGIEQAHALAEALRGRTIDAIYHSPLSRASETAARIGAVHHLSPRVEDALREVHLGSWQGYTVPELSPDMRRLCHIWRIDPAAVRPPYGETLYDARARIAPAVTEILAAHAGGTVALVMHSIIGRVLLCHLLGFGLYLVPRFKLKVASITLLRLGGEGAVLERLGDVGHLRDVAPARTADLVGASQ